MINLLELLGGPGRYILGLDPHPAPTSPPNPASRGNAASSGESVGTSGRVTLTAPAITARRRTAVRDRRTGLRTQTDLRPHPPLSGGGG